MGNPGLCFPDLRAKDLPLNIDSFPLKRRSNLERCSCDWEGGGSGLASLNDTERSDECSTWNNPGETVVN